MTARSEIADGAWMPVAETHRPDRAVALWLFACCAAILAMVVIGGITRLTESGLSIAVWEPLLGWIPPLSGAEWERLFAIYRQTSEYQLVNAWMTVADFRTIFWWEYIHRLWGRLLGVVFLVPLLVFAWRGRIDRGLGLRLLAIFALGGLQGAIGWWMVKSGLVDRTSVSPYRLAVHLGVALLIYGLVLWTALEVWGARRFAAPRRLRAFAWAVVAAICLTILAGAFVAGTRGGLVHNTFPLMGGALVPPDYLMPGSLLRNALENPVAAQFHHRAIAVAMLVLSTAFWVAARRAGDARIGVGADLVLAGVLVQAALGVATLLLVVPIWLAALHQAGAVALLTFGIFAAYRLRGA